MEKKVNLDKYFALNTFSISLSEFLWGVGIPVILESTFLTVFLTYIKVTNFQISITSFIFTLSMAIVPFFSAYITAQMKYKKPATIISQYIPSLSVLLLGINLIFFYKGKYSYEIFLFYYTFFAIGLSSTVPIWQNYITKIYNPDKVLKGISIMMFFQNTGKIIGGLLITFLMAKYTLNEKFAGMLFIFTGILFFLGSSSFILTKENPDELTERKPFFSYYLFYFKQIIKNKNILYYLLQDIEFNMAVISLIFYAKYAVEVCKINVAIVSGIFVILNFIGAISANFTLGFLEKISLKLRYLFVKVATVISLVLLILSKNIIAFYIVSILLGFSRSGRIHLYIPVVKKLSHLNDASPYYAILPFIMLPFSSLLPIFSGIFLDKFSYLNNVYTQLFLIFLIITLISFIPFAKIDFEN